MQRKLAITLALTSVLGGVWAAVVHNPLAMAAAVLLFLAAGWLARRALDRKPSAAAYGGIEIDQHGVRNGEHALRWSELTRIQIITTDEGPFVDDLFWIFEGPAGQHCIIPGPALDSTLFEHLNRLPGVDYEQIIRAQGSCEDARFLIWTAPPAAELTA